MATTLALVSLASAIVDRAEALSGATLRSAKTIRPASVLQGCVALLLSPKGLYEVGEGKPLLVLDSVLGHLTNLVAVRQYHLRSVLASLPGRAELCC